MLISGKSGNISFATVNILGTSNEDRNCANFSHLRQLKLGQDIIDGDFSSFGIFDGHNGVSYSFPPIISFSSLLMLIF
jgi:hypothetical protein